MKLHFPFLILFLLSMQISSAQQVKSNGGFHILHPNGKVFIKGENKKGLPHGRWEFFLPDGGLYEIHHYKKGLLNDTFYQFVEGTLLMKGLFKNNLREGVWTKYDSENKVTIWTYKSDTLTGWYKDQEEHIYFMNGKANGPFIKFDHHGKIIAEGQFVNDSREGLWRFRSSYSIKLYNFKNNQLNGTCYQFDQDSNLYARTGYVDGRKEGLYEEFQTGHKEDGTPFVFCILSTSYQNGKKNGPEYFFNTEGDTMGYTNFSNDDRRGSSWRKNAAGQITVRNWYGGPYEGDSTTCWHDNGQLAVWSYSLWRHRGDVGDFELRWDESGNLYYRDTTYYEKGELKFDHIHYQEGELIRELHTVNGNQHGRDYLKDDHDIIYDNGVVVKVIKSAPEIYDDGWGNMEMTDGSMQGFDEHEETGFGPYDRLSGGDRELPEYPGCVKGYDYFKNETEVTPEIKALQGKGKVVVRFYLLENGAATCFQVVNRVHPLLDSEAIRIAAYTHGYCIKPGWREIEVGF